MKAKKLILGLFLLGLSLTSCGKGPSTLKEAYKDYFPIGITLNKENYKLFDDIIGNFNSMTCENEMKWSSIHPGDDVYVFDDGDRLIDYAKSQGMGVRGHALVWHKAVPSGIFYDNEGNYLTKEVMFEKLREHIFETVKHFKDDVYVWDVVNEAIDDSNDALKEDNSNVYFKCPWYDICGPEYVLKSFEYAREALDELEAETGREMNVKLFYNDFSLTNPNKRAKTVEMIQYLIENNAPIDGIGMQSHYHIGSFSIEEFKTSIETFASFDLEVQITELDVSVYDVNENVSSYEEGLPEEIEAVQTAIYDRLFEICREYKENITGITFWSPADDSTWLDHELGKKDYPTLFDIYHEPKSSFYEVMDF